MLARLAFAALVAFVAVYMVLGAGAGLIDVLIITAIFLAILRPHCKNS